MAKYDDLCTMSQDAINRYNQYTTDCYEFAGYFFSGLNEYLNCPEDTIKFYQLQEPLDINRQCLLRDAMSHSPDGFFEIYFSLTLKQPDLEDTILIAMRIKKNADCFIVRIGMSRQEFEIRGKEDSARAYDYIFDAIKTYYERDGFIKTASTPIGFAV